MHNPTSLRAHPPETPQLQHHSAPPLNPNRSPGYAASPSLDRTAQTKDANKSHLQLTFGHLGKNSIDLGFEQVTTERVVKIMNFWCMGRVV